MISNADFKSNPALRESLLSNFRDRIKNKSTMPPWMYIELTELQNNELQIDGFATLFALYRLMHCDELK